jgi:hypothetical protein
MEGRFRGAARATVKHPLTLQTCTHETTFTFTTVTAGRIEGWTEGPSRFEWQSCRVLEAILSDFVWVPLAE